MKRTVLLCRVDGNFGGVERFVLSLARNLDPQRYRPVVVPILHDAELARQAREAGLEVEFLPMRNRLDIGRSSDLLLEIARKHQADAVHTFGIRSNTLAAYAKKRLSMPWVIRLPNINATDYNNRMRGYASYLFNNWLIQRADALQVISPQLETAIQNWRRPPLRMYFIPNGVDTIYYQSGAVKNDIRREWYIPQEAPVIGSVGRLEKIKGYDLLIEAYARLLHEIPEARLVLVGAGIEQKILEEQVKRSNLPHPVIFAGYTSDVRTYLSAFTLFVCSSHSEGVPNALMEAMAMGTPAVSTRVGGVESVIRDGVDGVLLDSNQPEVMSRVMAQLLRDEEKLTSLRMAARERIVDSFSINRVVEQVQDMYDELIHEYNINTTAGRSA